MPRKSTYRHAARSMTSSTDAAPTAEEGSDAPAAEEASDAPAVGERSSVVDITTSRSPTDGAAPSLHARVPSPCPHRPGQPGWWLQ
jgi:hypothetical protein